MIRIAIFASGSGTNAEAIINYFSDSSLARVILLMSDNQDAFALKRAERLGVETAVFSREEFAQGDKPLDTLLAAGVDYIVLAGFLRLVPENIIRAFGGRIINIHPALLPKYGGRGMYGERVHQAVIAAGEPLSGITIHRVNEHYDQGAIIAQYTVEVSPDDTPETLATKIHALEHRYFPEVIEQEIKKI
jgi:phosphoribosylglycinamide formyltransferase-1